MADTGSYSKNSDGRKATSGATMPDLKQKMRQQVLDDILKRARSGKPWERLWEGPMKKHGITVEEVRAILGITVTEPTKPASSTGSQSTNSQSPISHSTSLQPATSQSTGSAGPGQRRSIPPVPTGPRSRTGPVSADRAADESNAVPSPPAPDQAFDWKDPKEVTKYPSFEPVRRIEIPRCQYCKEPLQSGTACVCETIADAEPALSGMAAVDFGSSSDGEVYSAEPTDLLKRLDSVVQGLGPSNRQRQSQNNHQVRHVPQRPCPRCQHQIDANAIICSFCNLVFMLAPSETSPPPKSN